VPTGSSVPAGAPISRKLRHAPLPKQPTTVCDGQNAPVALLTCAVPVVSGVRFTPMMPAEMLPSEPPVVQSLLSFCGLVVVHARPWRAPRSQVPVNGLVGPGVPATVQMGQGWPTLAAPVTLMSELSEIPRFVITPVEMSIVPVASDAN